MALPLKEKKSLLLFVGLILSNLILISIQVPQGTDRTILKRAFLTVFTPVQAGVAAFGRSIESFWNNYLDLREVQKQNQKFREELFFLRQENVLLKNVLQKLGEEAQMRERLARLSSRLLVATVIGCDSGNIFKSIIINRGSYHGVKTDMVVLDPQGNLLGRVIDPVLEWTTRVQLITDETSGVGVVTRGKKVVGVLRGNGRGQCYLDYVLLTAPEISVAEEVVTSGFDGIYPAGIPVGRVASVSTDGTLFRKILVEPYFRLAGLVQVAVVPFDLKDF